MVPLTHEGMSIADFSVLVVSILPRPIVNRSIDNTGTDALSTVQKFVCGRGYLRAADGSSFCTLAEGVVGQLIDCTDNGRLLERF